MTTIATDGQTMAGDSLTTAGGQVVFDRSVKVRRMKDGTVIGCSGNVTEITAFVRYMEHKNGDRPSVSEEFDALILHPSGKIEWMNNKFEPVQYLAPMAIGSGGDLAIGAMMAGASPKRAVAIACERDTCSGGQIMVLRPKR
jgi:ATP-dependent protease HslVU (ClpYQ) peptidase subunit